MRLTALTGILALSTLSLSPVKGAETNLSSGINQLGYRALQTIRANEKNKNLFISPLSLHEAMSMVYVGAEGATRTELATLLGIDTRDSSDSVADLWNAFRTRLLSADPAVKLAIANSMWGNSDNNVRFIDEFEKLNARAHDAAVRSMDFQSKSFLPTINGWVSEKTNGLIPSVLGGEIPKNQLFYLVNAIYFKGDWANEFDKKDTRDGEFRNNDGAKTVKMMNRYGGFTYAESRHAGQLVELPYGKTGNLTMTLHLPSSITATSFYSNIGNSIAALRAKASHKSGMVSLPRFHIEYSNEKVVDVFKAMGIERVFSNKSELTQIAQDERALVNVIIHKAVIDTNESGSEAAAVTVVGGARATSIQPELPFSFVADRPFYFEIGDKSTGTVLFNGVVNEPIDSKK
ncbi:MAG: serpin family protein [Deltaproteobacteria bacterium]|nr:serpin family protein [Deltaproteobacteria bacterium]